MVPDSTFGHEPPTSGELRAERKRQRRKARAAAERAGARELQELGDAAVAEALRLAPEVADAASRDASERVIDLAVDDREHASYLRRRINEALAVGEWLDEVEVWIWEAGRSVRPPLTERGEATGIELRLEQPRQH